MSFRVSGKHIELGEALRERISARVLEALEKYFDGEADKVSLELLAGLG